MSEVVLTIPGVVAAPSCRLCGGRAGLIVRPNSHTAYAYCGKCVDAALERAEITAAAR